MRGWFNLAYPLAIAGGTENKTADRPMDLPASVIALGEQLRGAEEISPDPALLSDADVFAAERARVFVQPLMAVDHASRLTEDHIFQVVTDPKQADAVFTDQIGEIFEAKLADLFPAPDPKESES